MNVTIRPPNQKNAERKPPLVPLNINSDGTITKTEKNPEANSKITKLDKKKCHKCEKKLSINFFDCKCGLIFCAEHRYPYIHLCSFDHKKEAFDRLKITNPHVESDKMGDRI